MDRRFMLHKQKTKCRDEIKSDCSPDKKKLYIDRYNDWIKH